MRKLLCCLVALAGAFPLRAAEPTAKELIEKAIAAHGGRTALESYPSLKRIGKVEMAGRRAGRSADLTGYERADGAWRREVEFEFRGRKMGMTEISDGAVRKRQFGNRGWDDLPRDEAIEEVEHRLDRFLLAALEREASVAGAGSEADTEVWYVEVPDGRGKARLGIARDSSLLVSLEYPGIKAEGMGTKEEVTRKYLYRDFRKVGELSLPFDVEQLVDGAPSGRQRFESQEALSEFDEALLAIPDPTQRFIPSEEQVF